jgi:hypothetical protein
VDWSNLSGNPNGIPLIERNWQEVKNKVDWEKLLKNPKAVYFIQKHWEEIRVRRTTLWRELSKNPGIFYSINKKHRFGFRTEDENIEQDFVKTMFNPKKYDLTNMYYKGFLDDDFEPNETHKELQQKMEKKVNNFKSKKPLLTTPEMQTFIEKNKKAFTRKTGGRKKNISRKK